MQHNASELVVREQMQAQINELNERLTEMQSAQSDSDHSRSEPLSPDTSLLVQTNRLRRKGTQYYQQERQRLLTQQQTQRQENKWHRIVELPVWSKYTLSAEQHTSLAQYRALEVQLRDSVTETPGYSGTVGERMVQWFRARLNRFLESVKGHALLSVKSDIERELRDSQHSDSATRKYCTGTPYGERTCLTDYCMCTANHVPKTVQNRQSNTTAVVTAGMISTAEVQHSVAH